MGGFFFPNKIERKKLKGKKKIGEKFDLCSHNFRSLKEKKKKVFNKKNRKRTYKKIKRERFVLFSRFFIFFCFNGKTYFILCAREERVENRARKIFFFFFCKKIQKNTKILPPREKILSRPGKKIFGFMEKILDLEKKN